MSYETGTASSYTDLLNKLNTFLLKGHALTPAYTGTGTGTITGLIGTSSSVQETITITLSSATAFSVSGSVTGSMGSGTVGTAFSHAKVAFTVNAGGTAWVNGDTIAFVMTPPWSAQRSSSGSEYIWKAPGNANTDAIYVGAKTFSNVSGDYYNWRLGGFTSYTSANDFTNQPGGYTKSILPLWNSSIPYWFIASGRRVIVVAKVSTVYEMAYLGLLDAYASPGQYPYPLVVGGSMGWSTEPADTSTSWRWSNQDYEHAAFWKPDVYSDSFPTSSLALRYPDGQWKCGRFPLGGGTYHFNMYPWAVANGGSHECGMQDLKPNLDGTYPLIPILLCDSYGNATATWGEFAGLMATTGYGNSSESTHPVGRDTWLVVQNVWQTTINDYCSVRLD